MHNRWLAVSSSIALAATLALPAYAIDHSPSPVPRASPKLVAAPASAAEPAGHEAEAKGHEAPAKAAPGHGAGKAAPPDPMDVLRERLAEKLGATKAPGAKSPYVMRVANNNTSHTTTGHEGGAHAKKASSTAQQRAIDEHRQGKTGADEHGHELHWAYSGEGGPNAWGVLKAEFAKCSTGTRQSPIDIRGGIPVDLEPVQFDYKPSGFSVLDNGHTVQVNVAPGNTIQVMGRRYELLQFHFHRPSEERINGRQFDMVAHLVHKDPEGRLAVVAVLLDRGSAHPLVQTVWNNLPLEKNDELAAPMALDMNNLLPQDRRYYTYMGSLTTPPCSEGVLWMVMQQAVPIAPQQIDIFARLYPMNARPIQQAAGRLIKQSN